MPIIRDVDLMEGFGYEYIDTFHTRKEADDYLKINPEHLVVFGWNPTGDDWWDVYKLKGE